MSMTVSVRVQHNNMSKAAGQRRHDLRSGKVIPAYVDQDRSHLNSSIIPPMMEAAARKECEERRGQNPHKREMKSTAAVLTNGIITFGAEAQPVIQSLPTEKQDQIYKDIAERLADRLNTDLVGLTSHRDESAPHAHFSLLAVNRNGQPLSKAIRKDVAKELQDIAGQVMAEHGLGEITRGKPKAQRIEDGEPMDLWTHRSVRKLHESLPADIAKAEERRLQAEKEAMAAEVKRAKNEQLAEKARQDIEAGKGDIAKVQKRLEAYERRVQEAKAEKERLEKLIKGVKDAMPELQTKQQFLSKNLSVSPENIENFMTEVSEFIAHTVTRNVQKKQSELDDFAKSLDARETILTKKEANFDKKMRGAGDLEERNRDLSAENQYLRQQIKVLTRHDNAPNVSVGPKMKGPE